MQEGMTFNQIAAQEKSGELDELDPNHLHEMRWYDAGLELQAMPESVIAKLKEIVKEKSVNLPSK